MGVDSSTTAEREVERVTIPRDRKVERRQRTNALLLIALSSLFALRARASAADGILAGLMMFLCAMWLVSLVRRRGAPGLVLDDVGIRIGDAGLFGPLVIPWNTIAYVCPTPYPAALSEEATRAMARYRAEVGLRDDFVSLHVRLRDDESRRAILPRRKTHEIGPIPLDQLPVSRDELYAFLLRHVRFELVTFVD